MITTQEFSSRRQKVMDQIGPQSIALFFANSEVLRNGDVHFPFRQNSDFYYMTGFNEPSAVAVLLPGRKEGEYILFNRPSDPLLERWVGKSAGQEGAVRDYGADQSFSIVELGEKIVELMEGRENVYYAIGKKPLWDKRVTKWIAKVQSKTRRGVKNPTSLIDVTTLTYEMRLIKSPAEILIMKKVSEISSASHIKAMQSCKPGLQEYELEAVLNDEFMKKGCRFVAYPSIVGGGENACTLHYIENSSALKDNEMVLIDAGAEYQNYASDITRTFPVNGKFSQEQAALYTVVLSAQQAVIDSIRPGIPWDHLQQIAVEHLGQGLLDLGILKGTLKDVIENKYYQNYYMHNIGHWLGLDVHDVGVYKVDGEWRRLEPGMILTVEPGLYMSPQEGLDKKWWNIGIRIEDDVLVTEKGCEVLTQSLPKTISEIEQLMNNNK